MAEEKYQKMLTLLREKGAEEFVKKYETWSRFFSFSISKDPFEAHHSVINLKLVVLCGLAESLGRGEGDCEKFKEFINSLSLEEKLFFALVVNSKKKNIIAQEMFEKYNKTGDEGLLKQLMDVGQKEDDEKQKEIEQLLVAYPDNISYIEEIFDRKIKLLYGVRSKIVHSGIPVVGLIMSSSGDVVEFYGEKEDTFFTIVHPLEDFFLRATCRRYGVEPESVVKDMEEYCYDKLLARHARSAVALISNLNKK